VIGLGRIISLASASFGAGLMAVSFAPVLWMALPAWSSPDSGSWVQMASSNTVIQTIVEDQKRDAS
jgi:hypothetical protein